MKVLIVEDDSAIAANLYDYLEAGGYEVDVAANGNAGLQMALADSWDAILLELSLPGMDGLTLCRRLREEGARDTPVLMLTARDALDDKLAGFVHGADDYLVKPFSLKEVGARLGAMIKRYRGQVATMDLRFADVHLDLSTMTVERAELEAEVWGEELPDSDTLRTHVYTLRRALSRPGETDVIETLHGVGYRLATSGGDAK